MKWLNLCVLFTGTCIIMCLFYSELEILAITSCVVVAGMLCVCYRCVHVCATGVYMRACVCYRCVHVCYRCVCVCMCVCMCVLQVRVMGVLQVCVCMYVCMYVCVTGACYGCVDVTGVCMYDCACYRCVYVWMLQVCVYVCVCYRCVCVLWYGCMGIMLVCTLIGVCVL